MNEYIPILKLLTIEDKKKLKKSVKLRKIQKDYSKKLIGGEETVQSDEPNGETW